MPNIALSQVLIGGSEADIRSLMADKEVLARAIDPLMEFETESPGASFSLHSRWADAFDPVAALAARHPNAVITVAAVELANGNAAARVYKGAEVLGEWTMPDAELKELCGSEYEELPVFESLFSTVSSYEADALEAMKAGRPAP